MTDDTLQTTPLDALHRSLGAKMAPFAGYAMPVQYPSGILTEHLHTRAKAGLFDVSHMGQLRVDGDDAAAILETLVPGDILGLAEMRTRYTQFTNDAGGILDDLMVTNAGDHLFVVVNAACKEQDTALLEAALGDRVTPLGDRALLAIQGPGAEAALAKLAPDTAALSFMAAAAVEIAGSKCFVTRSGYTGEDGFEISVPADAAEGLAERLLADPEVAPIGLGARDSLRLEAGLCLYGQDIDAGTSPVEAGLTWSIGKRRRADGGFPGAARVQREIADGPTRRRVGLRPTGRAPARAGTDIASPDGTPIGHVTSGGFGPSVDGPVAMGYVSIDHAQNGNEVSLLVRGKALPARVAKLPFVTPGYKR